jgi:hypothetical protein
MSGSGSIPTDLLEGVRKREGQLTRAATQVKQPTGSAGATLHEKPQELVRITTTEAGIETCGITSERPLLAAASSTLTHPRNPDGMRAG